MVSLIMLSGPSCAGKSPLLKSLKKIAPDKASTLEKVVLYNDRAIRPGESDGIDYHFRSHAEIKSLETNPNYVVIPVRNDLQALEIESVMRILDEGNNAFYEGAPYVVKAIREHPAFATTPIRTIFLSPLSKNEIAFFKRKDIHLDLNEVICSIMRRKQLVRKQKQRGILSKPDLDDVEIRCSAAAGEMKEAWKFDYVIPNHDGEDSSHWDVFGYPIGDAKRSVDALASILDDKPLDWVERWDESVMS